MDNVSLILVDDLHLEGRDSEEISKASLKMSNIIKEIKTMGKIPILICAGDISEGLDGVKWAKQFDIDTVYVCGNHEYWNQDFYEINEEIENFCLNTKIKFLNNKVIVLHNLRFVGNTLWTNLGDFLPWHEKNNIVKFYSAMGDFKKTTAKKWYTENNIQRLNNYLSKCGVEKEKINTLVENKFFNPLLEKEENYKSTEFLLKSLNDDFNGKTIVVTHHLPAYEVWLKIKNIENSSLVGDIINNEKFFLDSTKTNNTLAKEILMMGYYTNDLIDFMYSSNSPDFWLHGHLHIPVEEIVGKTKIISSPMGYKKQNSDLKYKIINPYNEKNFLKEYLINQINDYNFSVFLNILRELEVLINKFEKAVNSTFLSYEDIQYIINNIIDKYNDELNKLKDQTNEWLKLIVYAQHDEIHDKFLDFYSSKKLSGLTLFNNEKEGFIFPNDISLIIDEYSFKKLSDENNGSHYKTWLLDLQKSHVQITRYKKFLIEFINSL